MSVIIDAMEAAKREKARRESRATPESAEPMLIPLRTPSAPVRSRQRVLIMTLASVVSLAAITIMIVRLTPKTTLPAVPPLTSTILSEALSDSTNRTPNQPSPAATATPPTPPTLPTSTTQSEPGTPAPRVAARSSTSPAPSDTVAIPQGVARAAVADSTLSRAVPPSDARPGRLRVSVDRSRSLNAAYLFGDAVAAHRAGDLPTARSLYDSVLVLTPNDADALNNLGVLLSAQREYAKALEVLRRAAAASSRPAGVWNNIGTVFREQGKSDEAIAAFRRALVIDPGHLGAKVGLAQQYMAIKELPLARQLLDEVIASNPQLPEAYYTLGQVLELQGDRVSAIVAYRSFIKVAPARLAGHVELVRRHIETLSR